MYDICTEPPVIIVLHMNNYPDDGQAHAKHVGHNTVNKWEGRKCSQSTQFV